MLFWRSGAKKTSRVRAFILKGGRRRVSNMWVSSESQAQEGRGVQKKEEEVKKPVLVP